MPFPKLERRPELDALRGLFIVLMVMVHLPTPLSSVASQPFGFLSAAAGFVGLSGLLVGRIYFGPIARDEAGAKTKLWKRSLKLYGYHMLLLTLAFTVAAEVAVKDHRVAILNLLDFYLAHPVVAVAGSLLLIYCPPLFDILPMYVIFLAMTPLVLSAARRVGWRWVLACSAAVWLGAQFGLREVIHGWLVQATHMQIPLQETGAFNLFAWQMVWVAGLWIGASSAIGEMPLNRIPRWSVPVCGALCVFFFLARHGWLGAHLDQQSFGLWVDKWRLAPVRVLNAGCFGIVVWWLRRFVARLLAREPLLTFGKASLQVFCAHLFFVFVGLALLYGGELHIHGAVGVVLVLVSFPVLFGIAVLQVRKRSRDKGKARVPAVPEKRQEFPHPGADAGIGEESTQGAA